MRMTTRLGLARSLALGLSCSAAVACSSSAAVPTIEAGATDMSSSSSGGSGDQSSSSSSGGTAPSSSSSSSGGTAPSSSSSSGGTAPSSSSSSSGGTAPSSSGSGSGGMPDAAGGGSGGSGEGGAAGCPATATFCDGFEGATVGAGTNMMMLPGDSNWTVDNGVTANVVEIVQASATNQVHSGKNAVHLHFTTASGATFIDSKEGFPISGTFWGRVWMYMTTTTGDTGHDVYLEASDGMNLMNHGVRPLNTQGATMSSNIDPVNGGEGGGNSGTALPRGMWTCFEWSIGLSGTNGSVALFMNGTAVAKTATTFPSTGDVAIPSLIEMRVGFEHYNAISAAADMWLDDYAVGTAQIGCM
jgi:hypothetical protein